MLKRLLLCLFGLTIALSPFAQSVTIDGLTYTVLSQEEKTVSVKADNYDIEHADIQSNVNIDGFSYVVTEITENAFKDCYKLTNLNIPPSVSTIGSCAFSATNLTEIYIPISVRQIGDEILKDCKKLSKVTVKALTEILPKSTFSGCNRLSEVYLFCKFESGYGINADKVYTFKCFYARTNAIYYEEFLQREHITPLLAGCKIDYSERFNEFVVDGYEIKSMRVYCAISEGGGCIFDNEIELRADGKYIVKVPSTILGESWFRPYHISMIYYDPRAGRDITTDIDRYGDNEFENYYSYIPTSVTNVKTTPSTASFDITAPTDESTGKIAEFQLENFKESSKDGKFSLKNRPLGSSYSDYIKVILEDGREFTSPYTQLYQTSDLSFGVETEVVEPTSIDLVWTYDAGDANDQLEEASFTQSGDFISSGHIRNNRFTYHATGLRPRGTYDVTLNVPVKSQSARQKQQSFELPELVLTTLPARATSKDCAIICAETNMSEDEIGGGFEWRRYDAPDMVPSNSVACPVANSHMEGRLNGLSSGTYYKYRPFYEDATGQKTYGEWTAFGTADVDVYFVPTVYTYTARSVGSTSATLVGYALAGSEDVTEQGFEYWPEVTSRAATTEVKRVLATGQRMMATIDDLEPGMTYNVRAFATTKTETTYGELQQFETEAIDDPIEDSIEEVETVEPSGQFDIYTLTGVCVRRNATDLSGLRSGIYIANGRKIMVR